MKCIARVRMQGVGEFETLLQLTKLFPTPSSFFSPKKKLKNYPYEVYIPCIFKIVPRLS